MPRRLPAPLLAIALAVPVVVALGVGGCATTAPAATPETTAVAEAAFPRVIDVPAGAAGPAHELTIEREPLRIAALSYETAELVAELGLADRLVLVPEAVLNPALSNHLPQMAAVGTTIPTERDADPEAIIATAPDLVLLSPRHDLEDGLADVLTAAGIPVLSMPNPWSTPDGIAHDVRLVGEATGADAAAESLATALETGLVASGDAAADPADAPRILVLGNQAGRPFITAGSAFPLELVRLAGGVDVSEELGVTTTGPISVEQLIAADPDGILLIDMNGSGESLFAPVLDTPAAATVPAVAEGRILLLEGRQVQALGLLATVDGLDALSDWIGGLR